MNWRKTLIGSLAMAALVAGCQGPVDREQRGEQLYNYCAQCHGDAGEGNAEFRAPAIAGLPQWYLEAQLYKFRVGARGDHPDDLDGLRMRPMSRTLASQEEVTIISEYVANLPVSPPERTMPPGDAERGAELFETCVQCHGEDARGNRELNAPPLHNAADWYVVAQLQKFKAGIRGTDALDASGSQMRPMAVGLADEQAMLDVYAYIDSLE